MGIWCIIWHHVIKLRLFPLILHRSSFDVNVFNRCPWTENWTIFWIITGWIVVGMIATMVSQFAYNNGSHLNVINKNAPNYLRSNWWNQHSRERRLTRTGQKWWPTIKLCQRVARNGNTVELVWWFHTIGGHCITRSQVKQNNHSMALFWKSNLIETRMKPEWNHSAGLYTKFTHVWHLHAVLFKNAVTQHHPNFSILQNLVIEPSCVQRAWTVQWNFNSRRVKGNITNSCRYASIFADNIPSVKDGSV